MEFAHGSSASGPLSAWASLLEKWCELSAEYAESFAQPDANYWYGERASVSMLAGAAWRAGGIAIQEFRTRKQAIVGGTYLGRGDLWFRLSGQEFDVEAKEVTCKHEANFAACVSEAERRCGLDTGKLKYAVLPVSVTFVVLSIAASRAAHIPTIISRATAAASAAGADAVAWTFPLSTRALAGDDKRLYPGMILLARAQPRRAKTTKLAGAH